MVNFSPLHARVARPQDVQEGWYVIKQKSGEELEIVGELYTDFSQAAAESDRLNLAEARTRLYQPDPSNAEK